MTSSAMQLVAKWSAHRTEVKRRINQCDVLFIMLNGSSFLMLSLQHREKFPFGNSRGGAEADGQRISAPLRDCQPFWREDAGPSGLKERRSHNRPVRHHLFTVHGQGKDSTTLVALLILLNVTSDRSPRWLACSMVMETT